MIRYLEIAISDEFNRHVSLDILITAKKSKYCSKDGLQHCVTILLEATLKGVAKFFFFNRSN